MTGNETKSDQLIGLLITLSAMAFTAAGFWHELFHPTAHMSDVTLHLSLLKALDEAVRQGGSAFDFWYDHSPFGYPLFRTYQHLPHLLLYLIYRLCGGEIQLESLLRFSTFVLATILPPALVFSARLFGLGWIAAGFSALSAVLLAERGDYGLGMHNFLWGSGGIITQLWAAVFLFPALGLAFRYLKDGHGYRRALLFAFLTSGCHMVAAFILGVSLVLFAVVQTAANLLAAGVAGTNAGKVFRRLAAYFLALAVLTSYQWVFVVLDGPYLHTSPHEPAWKYAAWGVSWVVENFWNGDLFDYGRFPGVTILVLLGSVSALFGLGCSREPDCALDLKQSRPAPQADARSYSACSSLVLGLLLWLLLLCGWELWGWLFSELPLLRTLHMHRLIVGVHAFGSLLAGLGAFAVFKALRLRWLALLVSVALLGPAVGERWQAYQRSHLWLREALVWQAEDQDLKDLLVALHAKRRGWVHVGMEQSWAKELSVGMNLRLRHVTIGEGLPTMGQLFHAYGLSGDVLFDFNPYREAHYRALGVLYTVAPLNWPAPAFLEEIGKYGRYRLLIYPRGGMLDVVRIGFEAGGEAQPEEMSRFMRNWLTSPLVERGISGRIIGTGKRSALPFAPISGPVPLHISAAGEVGRVIWEDEWRPEYAQGRVRMNEEGYVLLKTGFHPNWHAFVDGKEVKTEWVTPGFVAAPCPAGEHELSFVYRGSRLKPWLFYGAFFLILAGFVLGRWLRSSAE